MKYKSCFGYYGSCQNCVLTKICKGKSWRNKNE